MNLDQLQLDLNVSLKAGRTDRVDTLRFLIAAVHNRAIAKYGASWKTSITDADIDDVVKRQIKTHKESIEAFENANRTELANKEKRELAILEEFAPKELSDEELKKLLEPVVAGGETDFGLLMKSAMEVVAGRADGGRVSGILRQMQTSN